LRSIYNVDGKYIEPPEAMERAFHAAIDAKAVPSDVEPKSYSDAMRRPDSELWRQAMVRKMETLKTHLEPMALHLCVISTSSHMLFSRWASILCTMA
jgi:hypothetical protein